MELQQSGITSIIVIAVFSLAGIIMFVLGFRDTENRKKKRFLLLFAGMSVSISVFGASLLVESERIKDILTTIATLSISVIWAFGIGYIISEYRRKNLG